MYFLFFTAQMRCPLLFFHLFYREFNNYTSQNMFLVRVSYDIEGILSKIGEIIHGSVVEIYRNWDTCDVQASSYDPPYSVLKEIGPCGRSFHKTPEFWGVPACSWFIRSAGWVKTTFSWTPYIGLCYFTNPAATCLAFAALGFYNM